MPNWRVFDVELGWLRDDGFIFMDGLDIPGRAIIALIWLQHDCIVDAVIATDGMDLWKWCDVHGSAITMGGIERFVLDTDMCDWLRGNIKDYLGDQLGIGHVG